MMIPKDSPMKKNLLFHGKEDTIANHLFEIMVKLGKRGFFMDVDEQIIFLISNIPALLILILMNSVISGAVFGAIVYCSFFNKNFFIQKRTRCYPCKPKNDCGYL